MSRIAQGNKVFAEKCLPQHNKHRNQEAFCGLLSVVGVKHRLQVKRRKLKQAHSKRDVTKD